MTTQTHRHAHGIRTWRAAMVGVAVGVLGIVTAGTASATPSPRLPDADLFCPGDTVVPQGEWVSVPGSDTLWIFTGPLAGHYSILTDTHYAVEGYQEGKPDGYDPATMVQTKTWGQKTGLTDVVRCDFVSRWGDPEDPATYSIVGPITMARIGR